MAEQCNHFGSVCRDIVEISKKLHNDVGETKDDFSLGLHLVHEHHSIDRGDFNKIFDYLVLHAPLTQI